MRLPKPIWIILCLLAFFVGGPIILLLTVVEIGGIFSDTIGSDDKPFELSQQRYATLNKQGKVFWWPKNCLAISGYHEGFSSYREATPYERPHLLPMCDFVYALLKNRRRHRLNDDYVFAAENSRGYIYDVRHHIGLVVTASKIPFMLHDLRRTFLTIADSLDLSSYAIKRLANHKTASDVTAGYIISDVDRLREPVERIAQFILRHASVLHASGSRNLKIVSEVKNRP